MTGEPDVLVLGAGPAGLGAAWRAARAGRSVVVLERASRVGGLAGSFEVAGLRVDHGSHRLHPATPPDVLAELRGLLGADLQERRRNGRLRLGSAWVGFPLRAGELVRALPPRVLAGAALDAARSPWRRPRADTFADVLRAGLGPTLYGLLYAPYAEKLWGLPGEQVAGEQARVRVTADSPVKVAARVLRGGRRNGTGTRFFYPRRGFGQICESLADAAVRAGAQVRMSAEVRAVRPGAGAVEVDVGTGTLRPRSVLSTLPLTVLARLVEPLVEPAVREAVAGLRFRAMVLVYLVHSGGRWTSYDAHYLPGRETPVTRVSEPANYRSSTDDPRDRSVLCAEIPCAVGDPVWERSDDELAQLAVDTLAEAGLPPVRLAGVEVRRLPRVYPVYDLEHAGRLATVTAWADALPGVVTLGRLGAFAHDNSHHALVMARDVVAALGPDGRTDPAALAAARLRWAAHVVED